MPTPTDDNRELLTVVAYMKAAPGKRDELKTALEGLIGSTLSEDGCVNYDLHQGAEDPDLFVFYENWNSAAHLDAHLAAPHLVTFAGRLAELLDDKGLTIMRLNRIA
ncbi:putative quinol monooxygenase [Jatrophihabitans fulvus]